MGDGVGSGGNSNYTVYLHQCLVRTGFVLFRRVSQLILGHRKPLPRPGRMMTEPDQVKNIVCIDVGQAPFVISKHYGLHLLTNISNI